MVSIGNCDSLMALYRQVSQLVKTLGTGYRIYQATVMSPPNFLLF